MKNKYYKISRLIHKYLGFILLVFLLWMSLSGVLLNHPKAMRDCSVPALMVPEYYHPDNWNRSTLKSLLYIDDKKDSVLVYGNQGVYLSVGDTKNFLPCMNGEYPKAPWKKRTNHVVIDSTNNRLLAATNAGFYECDIETLLWRRIDLGKESDPIIKILQLPGQIVLVSKSCLYISENKDGRYINAEEINKEDNLNINSFRKIIPYKDSETKTISLIRVFFELHDGSFLGFPGKIIWDIAGLVLFFLCVSAIYIWYYPKKWKRRFKRKGYKSSDSERRIRSLFLKYHKKLGWCFSILLIVIFITGMFMRPPLIMSLAKGSIEKKWYPAVRNTNPWHYKIRNAFYDSDKQQIIMDCKDGIWTGSLEGNMIFKRLEIPVRIFAMGATVFEEKHKGIWLIGSFGGLQEYNSKTHKVRTVVGNGSKESGRPAKTMVTGYFKTSDNKEYVVAHRKGVCDMNGIPDSDTFVMPKSIREEYRMPLWNFLFELHNARIFKSFMGGIYILIIPLGGFLGLLILFSGIFDYWFVKIRTKKSKRN